MSHIARSIILLILFQCIWIGTSYSQKSKSIHIMPVRAFYTLDYLPIPDRSVYSINYFGWYHKLLNPYTKEEYNEATQELFFKLFPKAARSARIAKKIYSVDDMTLDQIQAENELFLRVIKEIDFVLKGSEKFNTDPKINRNYSHNMAPLIFNATNGNLPDYICYVICHAYSDDDKKLKNLLGQYKKEPAGVISIKAIFIETKTATIVNYFNLTNNPIISTNFARPINERSMNKTIKKFIKKLDKEVKNLQI